MDFELLRRRTAQVDDQHRAAMATITEDLSATHVGGDPATVATRRRFLQRASAGAAIAVGSAVVPIGAMAAAAQIDEEPGPDANTPGAGPEDPEQTGTEGTLIAPGPPQEARVTGGDCTTDPVEMTAEDLQVVQFAESVERAAVAAYGLALDTNQLQAQVAQSARTFQRHHEDHAEALYCLAGNDPVPEGTDPEDVEDDQRAQPNAALVAAIAPQIEAADTVEALLEVLYGLEEGAAATYLFALGVLETQDVAASAALILPVEGQHAVVWGQALDKPTDEWMPSFQTDAGALDPAEYAS